VQPPLLPVVKSKTVICHLLADKLQDLGARTKMVLTHTGIPADSSGAAGWAMAFRKLGAHLQAYGAR
jgi:hypothetical protein